jgi:DNA-binding MarR family transcriptional regulator
VDQTSGEVADRIIAAYTAVSRWASQDFKRAKAPLDLTSTQFAILAQIDIVDRATVSHVADRLDLTVPTIVRAVDALQRKCLVERRRSIDDAREVMIAITPEGRRIREVLAQMRRMRVLRLLSAMSEEQIAGLLVGFEGMATATNPRRAEERETG